LEIKMKKLLLVFSLALTPLAVAVGDSLIRFDGGIGVSASTRSRALC